jgi:hypothetical protein
MFKQVYDAVATANSFSLKAPLYAGSDRKTA